MAPSATPSSPPNPRVLFLSQYFWPEETTTSWLLSTLAFHLAEHGYRVSAIAGQPTYHRAPKTPWRLEHRGVRIERVWSTRLNKNSIPGRILNTATFVLSVFFRLAMRRDFDVLISVTNPPLLNWVVRAVQSFHRFPAILIIHDVYPDFVAAIGKMRKSGLLYRIWNALTDWSSRAGERVIVLGECMEQAMRRHLPPERWERIRVIPNWDVENPFRSIPRAEHPLIREWALQDKFIVLYAGNIGLFHDIETIVAAADLLRDQPVHFVFIGAGGKLPLLQQSIAERRLANVSVLPFRKKEDMPLVLTACDAALATLIKEATGLSVLSKVYGVLAAGRPVLAVLGAESETARMIRRRGCGIAVEPGDAEGLAAAILRLKNDTAEREAMGAAALRAFEEEYNLQAVGAKYMELIDEVWKGRLHRDSSRLV